MNTGLHLSALSHPKQPTSEPYGGSTSSGFTDAFLSRKAVKSRPRSSSPIEPDCSPKSKRVRLESPRPSRSSFEPAKPEQTQIDEKMADFGGLETMEVEDLARSSASYLKLHPTNAQLAAIKTELLKTQLTFATLEHKLRKQLETVSDLQEDEMMETGGDDPAIHYTQQMNCEESLDELPYQGQHVTPNSFPNRNLRIIQKAAINAALATVEHQKNGISTMLEKVQLARESYNTKLQWTIREDNFMGDPLEYNQFKNCLNEARKIAFQEAMIIEDLLEDGAVEPYLKEKLHIPIGYLSTCAGILDRALFSLQARLPK